MKKLFTIFLFVSILFSCQKDYYCECYYYNENETNILPHEERAGFYRKRNIDDAKAKCEKLNFPPNGLGDNGKKCTLK